MKRFLIILGLVALLSFPVVAEDTAEEQQPQLSAIPIPAGAAVTTEMNVSREQLAIVLPALAAESGSGIELDMEQLDAALGTLSSIQYAEMEMGQDYSVIDTIAMFEKQVGGKRVLFDISKAPEQGFLLLSMPDDGGFFFAQIKAERDKENNITGAEIKAGRLFGRPDAAQTVKFIVPTLLKLFATTAGMTAVE